MIEIPDPWRFENMLNGKTVVVGTGASISIYRIPDLIRDLRREGADVKVIMTPNSVNMIDPKVMQWASENPVVTEISGEIEHISLFQLEPENISFLVSPASYDLIGKMANGISDDPVSLSFSFALGNGNPVVIAPAMHKAMMETPMNRKNIETLERSGTLIVPPEMDSDKAKLSVNDQIIDYVARSFFGNELRGKKILIMSGYSRVRLDSVRDIVNGSTGFSGYWFCRNAFRLGAQVITYVGNSANLIPPYVDFHPAETNQEYLDETLKALRKCEYDLVIVPAALSDFSILSSENREKLQSGVKHVIELLPDEKIISSIRKAYKGKMLSFSLSAKTDPHEIKKKYLQADPDMIVHNKLMKNRENFGTGKNNYTFIERDKVISPGNLTKQDMTLLVLREMENMFKSE
ncbi:bifunctional phosphopantothenoylcysteine decarboxylase/phosphopantothenate--cysteine ligase CoaBC [Oxyplasma meridianum]|uniref:Bifunctional phosphopantothenoylcysteine decarboxylase/phosphopantothenate--cysteine ligase CoaBC n=1 Tax=Oxyplasma meridianum TaxID=3073602 RepID=A0AAX4NIJ0_9ARCH